ncbi:MAG: PEP-CTERM sorting domain-containing protein [Casimicrobiaceae bacterium]
MKTQQLIVAAGFALASSLASANVQYTFYANGVTESYAEQGLALFSFSSDGSSLSITLTDTVNPTTAVQSAITGLQFTLSSAPTAISLTSVTPTSVIDCSGLSGSSCPAGVGSTPYGWSTTLSGNAFALGNGSEFSYQPFGIVNANYLSGGTGGLGTPSNNPLLIGPVTFNFALTGLHYAPEANSVVFLFGDTTEAPTSRVPEPQSLALLAIGLMAAGWVSRRKYRRA